MPSACIAALVDIGIETLVPADKSTIEPPTLGDCGGDTATDCAVVIGKVAGGAPFAMTLAEGRREKAARHAEVAPKSQVRLAKGDVGSSPYSLGAALGALGIWAMRLTEEGQEHAVKALVQRALGVVLGRG